MMTQIILAIVTYCSQLPSDKEIHDCVKSSSTCIGQKITPGQEWQTLFICLGEEI